MVKEKEVVVDETIEALPERMYLLSALVQNADTLTELSEFVASHKGQVKKTESLGEKRLYFPVNKFNALTLVSVYFEATATVAQEIEKTLRHEQNIERFLLTTWRGGLEAPKRSSRYKKLEEQTGGEEKE